MRSLWKWKWEEALRCKTCAKLWTSSTLAMHLVERTAKPAANVWCAAAPNWCDIKWRRLWFAMNKDVVRNRNCQYIFYNDFLLCLGFVCLGRTTHQAADMTWRFQTNGKKRITKMWTRNMCVDWIFFSVHPACSRIADHILANMCGRLTGGGWCLRRISMCVRRKTGKYASYSLEILSIRLDVWNEIRRCILSNTQRSEYIDLRIYIYFYLRFCGKYLRLFLISEHTCGIKKMSCISMDGSAILKQDCFCALRKISLICFDC